MCKFTSVLKSQSGDGVRRWWLVDKFESFTDGDELGSSGITANRPRCTHGDVGPYVTAKKNHRKFCLIFVKNTNIKSFNKERKEPFLFYKEISSRSLWLQFFFWSDPFSSICNAKFQCIALFVCFFFVIFSRCLYAFTLRYNSKSSVWHLLIWWSGWIWWWTNPETAHPCCWCITFSHCQSNKFCILKEIVFF